MELVYLWVEKYKNIEKQGFNFSPSFDVKFTPVYEKYTDEKGQEKEKLKDDCELKITPKENHLKDFFGKNINITAIVGENGSGKSSLISNLPNPQYVSNSTIKTNYILVYKINEIKVISNIKLKTKYELNELYKYSFDYYSFNQDFLNKEFMNNFTSFLTVPLTYNNYVLSNIYIHSNYKIDLYKYQCIINLLIFKYSSISNIFTFNAKKIKFEKKFINIKELLEGLKSSLGKETYVGEYQAEPINIYEYLLSEFDKLSDKEKFLIYVLLKHYQKNKESIKLIYEIFENPDLTIYGLEKEILNFKNENLEIEKLKSFYNFIDKEDIFKNKLEIEKLKNELDVSAFFNLDIQNILDIEFYDEIDRKFKDLSQGERHIFSFVLLIYARLLEQENKNKLILLDEPDITLHPQWQKRLLSSLIKTFEKLKDFSIHFIITSHSPFILSDLPKENVIFLEKGKQVYPFEDGKQTFGANIHTLLSHGFFMKDGLMGEFAKEKIQSIIKYHEELLKKELTKNENKKQRDEEKKIYEKEHKTKFWQIQSIIGDDYLKQVIKNHLVEIEKILYDEYLIDKEIKKLKDEIERLERLKK
ncbi:AAA family ATPase [Aliarcobacter butzleri]|uniref:AAA family ATPase n=1 Tax=Aliarcobacter butzleri TaxID=28197 RepID=UPI003AF644BE